MDIKDEATDTHDVLVIGYGNTLRRDDGVGPKVADAVAELKLPGVRALSCHQLTPELAEPISHARRVIFVDAATDAKAEVELREIQSADASQVLAHATDPRSLLALARQVFGRHPRAWSVVVPAQDLGFGDSLSPAAQHGFDRAVELVRDFCLHL